MKNLQKYNQTIFSVCVCNEFTIAITKKDKDMTIILLIVQMMHALEGMCKEVTKAETKVKNTVVI